MKSGTYDMAFGAVSGNSLNPLNFAEVLKSDNSSGFTLNWGPDTSKVTNEIVYDGKVWSFDGLWQAADSAAILSEAGQVAKLENASTGGEKDGVKYDKVDANAKSATYTISVKQLVEGGIAVEKMKIYVVSAGKTDIYTYDQLGLTNQKPVFTVTVGKEHNEFIDQHQQKQYNEVVSIKVEYPLTLTDGTTIETTSMLNNLKTYYGITGKK